LFLCEHAFVQSKSTRYANTECRRWDSSDPERAPPPLPMNPSSPSVVSRPNTSNAIKSAHAALTEKARENVYTINPITPRSDTSPERSLIKGAAHKRMQSIQTGNVRDLSHFIEGGSAFGSPRSPEKTASRPPTPHASKDFPLVESKSPEKESNRSSTPTPSRDDMPRRDSLRDPLRDSLTLRPSLRRPPQSILGENTPPQSATMLALQNMASRDVEVPLASVTNGSTALVRTPQTFDAISNQILSLTSICTNLQREMAQLSRRSKDNATDLVSLKEATNSRDEDIRKSLRELVTGLSEAGSRSSSNLYGGNGLFLDSKAHNSPKSVKQFVLPRIPSPNSFAASFDRESMSTPSLHSDSTVSIALLEKILREMGTKEGQEQLVSRLSEVADRLAREGMSTAKKLEDLVQFIKDNTTSQELIARNGGGSGNIAARKFSFEEPPRLELDFEGRPGPMAQRVGPLLASSVNKENRRDLSVHSTDVLSEDVLKIIRTVKDSVAQGGGLTAEVKALVRELRGEVLGMGREIGRKLDEASKEGNSKDEDKEHVARVVQGGLEELKEHFDRVMRENRRQSGASTVSRSTVDYQEVYNAVRAAVNENTDLSQKQGLEKEDIIQAVREAWENYKPDIELQHFGLEREELLACLKEGIQEFAPQDTSRDIGGATREEVFTAVVEGLKHFSPPRVETEASMSRDEILDAVRECLEEFEFPSAPPPEPREADITRDDMVDAVKEGLHSFDFGASTTALTREVGGEQSLNRDDVFEAVKAGLESAPLPADVFGEELLQRLQEIMETMRSEFKAVSEEAKENVAAHGRDTEQLLDATKDGFDRLRGDIESYVDRVVDISVKDEILDSVQESFITLRSEIETLLSRGSDASMEKVEYELERLRETMSTSLVPGGSNIDKDEIIDALREGLNVLRADIDRPRDNNDLGKVQEEIERLRESMSTSLVPGGSSIDKDEIIHALREGLDSLRADIERPRDSNESVLSGTGEILDAVHDGLNGLRAEVEKIGNKPVDMTVNYEILDTLKAGLEFVRADIDRLRENGIDHVESDRAVAQITDGAVVPADGLKRNDIENLEVLITQLRIKVEALESIPPPPAEPTPGSVSKDDLGTIEEMLRNVQESVIGLSERDPLPDIEAATKEDIEAIETLLLNTKAKLDEINPQQILRKEDLDSVEAITLETKESINEMSTHLEDVSKRDDINIVEALVREVMIGLAELKEKVDEESNNVEKATKTDIEAVEAVCLEVKASIEQTVISDMAALASKEDVQTLAEMVKEFKGRIETHAETNAKSFEERQAETVGVGERVSEIKTFLEEFRDAIKDKLDDGAKGVESLGKFLASLGETISQNANITDDIKKLFEAMTTEFEKSNAGIVGSKLETDEKFQQTWDKFDSKLEEKFGELILKYDDAQIAAEAKAKLAEEKSAETETAMLETKQVTEDVRLLIDALNTNVTESVEKLDESSKTVFNRVDDTFNKVEETRAEAMVEHQLTRDEVLKTLGVVEGVQGNVTEYNPKILESIKDVLLVVGQHYEHSKTAASTIQQKIEDIPPPPEMPVIKEAPVVEKYDDTNVHEKLDKLVDHMHSAGKSFAQLDMLDKIHRQVMQTAAEVSEFVSIQTQRIADDHEDKEKALEAATIALEKRIAQKDSIESTVAGLREEEEHLKASVALLKTEQEDLTHQKMRLSADVSSLETALRIRREELHAMEARAEGLERRILEGVIDHSRALLMSKANKGKDAMSRKRVPSHTSTATGSAISTATSRASNTTQSAINMAMGGNRAAVNVPINNPTSASRRILSLSQINNNIPTGGNFKRSHSVKALGSSGALRKTSWGGSVSNKYGDLNKENLALNESEEDEEDIDDGDVSDSGTMRRSSRGTTIISNTNTGVSESIDEGAEWTGSVDGESAVEDGAPVVLYEPDGEVA